MSKQERPSAPPAPDKGIRKERPERAARRFGVEQELLWVDRSWGPAPAARRVLEKLQDPRFAVGSSPLQLAVSSEPLRLSGDGLACLQGQLAGLLEKLRSVSGALGLHAVLVGALPTMRASDVEPDLAVEGYTAGFHVHLEVDAEELARMFNVAQVLAAPLVAVASSSALSFGEPLWAESRIALFEQSAEARAAGRDVRDGGGRAFGNRWVKESILEPSEQAETVRGWNRVSFGVGDVAPYLRIEIRALPAGTSLLDEIANAAFWLGAMLALGTEVDDVTRHIGIEQAAANFLAAARDGIGARLVWLDAAEMDVADLVSRKLLPMAAEALLRQGLDERDVRRYLGVVERRVRLRRTGARWMLASLQGMGSKGTAEERLKALVAATVARQGTERPVSEWARARLDEAGGARQDYQRVERYMTSDISTVQQDEPIDRVADLMGREGIRHVPVEDAEHRLVGLVSYRALMRHLMAVRVQRTRTASIVADIMRTDVRTAAPDTPTVEAIALMRRYRIGCLPVVQEGRLVGIVTEEDFMDIAAELLGQKLSVEGDS